MRGKPIILTNCEENIDNVITPLIHHRNTAEENDKNEGTLSILYKDPDLMKYNVIVSFITFLLRYPVFIFTVKLMQCLLILFKER